MQKEILKSQNENFCGKIKKKKKNTEIENRAKKI